MNKTLISGMTATLLLTSAIAGSQSSKAEPASAESQNLEANLASNPTRAAAKVGQQQTPSYPAESRPEASEPRIGNAVKVGEQQIPGAEASIAKIQSHDLSGRKAATLYVKNIPVLTFVGQQQTASSDVKVGEVQTDEVPEIAKLKTGSANSAGGQTVEQREHSQNSDDPVAQATAIAARLNQLYQKGLDANSIVVSWEPVKGKSDGHYAIKSNQTTLVAVSADAVLPDTKQHSERDALQVANRLRRLMGNAAPLATVQNRPKINPNEQQISLGPVKLRVDGWASWYGPGFHGNLTANGDVYDQEAMTAAHKSLPFGTKVRVTNLDNGKVVVVRINDRGPYVGDRVIDLSAGAARILGLMQSGVAPVRLEILERRSR
jgi:rare lipoprotein A